MTDEERKQLEDMTRERDFWRAKYRSCAWCKGNVELADHSDDCPVRQCQRLEVERDELRGVVEAVRLERGEREQLDCIGIDGSYADRWKAAERHVKAQQRVYAALDKLDGKEAP